MSNHTPSPSFLLVFIHQKLVYISYGGQDNLQNIQTTKKCAFDERTYKENSMSCNFGKADS